MNHQAYHSLQTNRLPRSWAWKEIHLAGVIGLLMTYTVLATPTITDTGQGVYNYTGSAVGLSGLTHRGGNQYSAISDQNGSSKIHNLTIDINHSNGRITGASLGTSLSIAGYDSEGIAYHPGRGSLFVSDEGKSPAGGAIREFDTITGNVINTLAIPSPLDNNRNNYGLESMSIGAGSIWSANEEALAHESSLSTASVGSMVRLQQWDATTLNPTGQWAYQVDGYGGDPLIGAGHELSGISDLLALPDGNLLVLERSLGGTLLPSLRNRIYLVDFSGASDTSSVADLDAGGFTPVSKTLLWEKNMGSTETHNFEGISLGETLDDGSLSLLLIADNGSGTDQQHLYALKLSGVPVPEPSTPLMCAISTCLLLLQRKRK